MSDNNVVTNPLEMLNPEQRKAINDRFNESWRKPRKTAIEAMQELTGMSFYDSCFAVGLQEDADNILRSKRISRVADTMLSNAADILRGNEDIKTSAFHSVQSAYDTLDKFDAPKAGKRFLDLLFKSKEILKKDAIKIQDAVLGFLEVKESEWM